MILTHIACDLLCCLSYSKSIAIIAVGPGAARRGALGARTVRAPAAAVGPGAARRGAQGARTVRATAAAVGPGGRGGGGGKSSRKCHLR